VETQQLQGVEHLACSSIQLQLLLPLLATQRGQASIAHATDSMAWEQFRGYTAF
jgi:hypothetical protein